MIDSNDFDALFDAFVRHPNYLSGVVWTVQDVRDECEFQGIDFDKVDLSKFDFRGWESVATEDGWPVITEELGNY